MSGVRSRAASAFLAEAIPVLSRAGAFAGVRMMSRSPSSLSSSSRQHRLTPSFLRM